MIASMLHGISQLSSVGKIAHAGHQAPVHLRAPIDDTASKTIIRPQTWYLKKNPRERTTRLDRFPSELSDGCKTQRKPAFSIFGHLSGQHINGTGCSYHQTERGSYKTPCGPFERNRTAQFARHDATCITHIFALIGIFQR